MSNTNPLIDFQGLPPFAEIRPEHIEPALDHMLERNRRLIDGLVEREVQPDWENFAAPLEELHDDLERMWAPVSHLNGVKDTEELRNAYEACLPKLSEYAAELGQNRGLFEKFRALSQGGEYSSLSVAQKQSVENELRDFRLSGIDLDPQKQERYVEITTRLSQLGNQFSQNVLDATDAWFLHISDSEDLSGLPNNAIELGRSNAQQKSLDGWVFDLRAPSYIPFMTYADRRDLREKMYYAYVTRASDQGPNAGQWDNSPLICEILNLRLELAKLLGFADYAAYSLETKMASSATEVLEFLNDLADKSLDPGRREVRQLEDFAASKLGLGELLPWDYAWASEKLKIELYDISDEDLRPYFPQPKVIEGMFDVVSRLFGIEITEQEPGQIWNPEVRFYRVTGNDGETRGYFYVDLFARAHKRGGAWMADCIGRRVTERGVQLPVAFLNCNFTEPADDKPSLLTHNEVTTLFHEFGHTLHHLLTRVDVAAVAGINGVPWDAVELPSQFLENWCWEREALDLISGHHETGESLPEEMLDKMRNARNFQSAMQMLRQIEFSLFDLELHHADEPCSTPQEVRNLLVKIRERVSVVDTPDFNRFENSFGHIFAGGYAAGYYSYKWAEVLSADAYSRFEEEGIFDPKCGRQFLHHILERGGSRDPMTLFIDFRGRKPSVEALLRHSGLS